MKKIPLFFNKQPIEFIHQFENTQHGTFKSRSSYLNGIQNVELKFDNNEFVAEFDEFKIKSKKGISLFGKIAKNVTFKTLQYELLFERVFFGSFSTGYVNSMSNKGFSKELNQYHKLVIPLERKIDFRFQLSHSIFISDFKIRSSNATFVNINNENLYILFEQDRTAKKHYLIIESDKKQNFKTFSEKAFAIRVALGYMTGHFSGNRGYFFSYGNKKREKFKGFVFHSLRKEIKNIYHPIHSNAYSWLSTRNKAYAKKTYKNRELRELTKEEFSKLCEVAINNGNFLSILMQMLESSQASLLTRPGGYSIVLETLSDIIIGDKKEKLAPITSKPENKKFRKDLIAVLDKHSQKDCFKDIETLKLRINNINQVTNKERLRLPFKLLNIKLSEEDLKIITSRNDFLHGRVPDYRELGEERSINDKDRDLHYAAVRLYTLLNKVILKYIGYDNYILNFSKVFEKDTGYLTDEEYYVKI